jgi:hypothetical protein
MSGGEISTIDGEGKPGRPMLVSLIPVLLAPARAVPRQALIFAADGRNVGIILLLKPSSLLTIEEPVSEDT